MSRGSSAASPHPKASPEPSIEVIPKTIAEICEGFFDLERQERLLEWSIAGVYLWPVVRMELYYKVTRALGVFGAPHGTSRSKGRVWAKAKLWSYATASLLFRPKRAADVLIFDHSRKVKRGEVWVDVYTEGLIEELSAREIDVEVYTNLSYANDQLHTFDVPRRYHDAITTLAKLGAKISPQRLSDGERAKIKRLERLFASRLGVTLKLERYLRRRITEFRVRHRIYTRLLRAHRPRSLVVVVSYAQSIMPLIAAAKSLKIPTVELQHGTFSRYHLGYHFPHEAPHPYFCDTFFVFGAFWREMADLPIATEEARVHGFRHLYDQLLTSMSSSSDRDAVLFISQGVIGEGLSRYAVACARAHVPWRLVYKLHPSEYLTWRDDYPLLRDCADHGLIQVVDHSDVGLYTLMSEAYYQVGVFSTAIYEGLALGCHTLIADLPGIEYMIPLIDRGEAEHMKSEAQLIERLQSVHLTQDERRQRDVLDGSSEVFASLQSASVDWLLERSSVEERTR